MPQYVMALDAGTTSNRAIIFDRDANTIAVSQQEFTQYFPHPGWVEHDAEEIWYVMRTVMRDALKKSELSAGDISAIGITNQRETAVVWNRLTGKPVRNAIVWQSRQTVSISDDLKKRGLADEIRHKTGLPVDAYFSGTKISWILDHIPDAHAMAERGELLFGTIETWLIWNLTGGKVHVTDCSNASRTLIYNIRELKWDNALLGYLNIPKAMLPEVRPSSCIYGYTDPGILGASIPVSGALGDQQAALFGQTCFQQGMTKNTYGTGCFLLMNTGSELCESKNGLASTIAWSMNGKVDYALEGSVFVAGAAIQWLRDEVSMIGTSAESEQIAASVPDSDGVYLVPAFTGLGAPYWDENARGMLIGITRGTTGAHIVRAALESIAYQTKDILCAVEADTGIRLNSLNVDGGAAANDLLMQFQADILGIPVNRARNLETTALGAAYAAGLAVGVWKDTDELARIRRTSCCFTPEMMPDTAAALCRGWKKAVRHATHWLDDD